MTPHLIGAFAGGMVALGLRLPPLVGFLAAGLVLSAMGYELTPEVDTISSLGVTLLLFTIGLKLNVRSLLRAEVWGASTIHLAGTTLLLTMVVGFLKVVGLGLVQDLRVPELVLVGFSLSFSSTVFAVKVLEARSEMNSLYGRVAIGVLIMQDLFAVAFLTASAGSPPRPWAVLLLLLLPLSRYLRRLLDWLGHGEMQVLFGVLLALVLGYALFEFVGVKGDLGALVVGVLLAPAASASQLSKALFNMKELFLVGFFLSVGLTGLPTWESAVLALALVLVLPLKSALYLLVFSRFRLRGRTSLLASLSLSNYSEFGLIVAGLAASEGWLDPQWLVVLALALSLSFILASPLNNASERLYRRWAPTLGRFETAVSHPSDQPIDVGDVDAVILGMGRIGRGAYERLVDAYGQRALGVDNDVARVRRLRELGYDVAEGDAANSDFWEKLLVSPNVRLVVLAMPHHAGNIFALDQLRDRAFGGRIAAVVQYEDEVEPLRARGADAVFNLYGEAGHGLADDAVRDMRNTRPQAAQD